jgi:hypothetical protein
MGHLGSKTRSPRPIIETFSINTLVVTFFDSIVIKLGQDACLMSDELMGQLRDLMAILAVLFNVWNTLFANMSAVNFEVSWIVNEFHSEEFNNMHERRHSYTLYKTFAFMP